METGLVVFVVYMTFGIGFVAGGVTCMYHACVEHKLYELGVVYGFLVIAYCIFLWPIPMGFAFTNIGRGYIRVESEKSKTQNFFHG